MIAELQMARAEPRDLGRQHCQAKQVEVFFGAKMGSGGDENTREINGDDLTGTAEFSVFEFALTVPSKYLNGLVLLAIRRG